MLKRIYNENPNEKKIDSIVKCLQNGGLIIYPTDTVYALGCDIYNKIALERIAKIKGVKLKNANFSIICFDLSNLSKYAKQISSRTFKLLKRIFPGPFTIILKGTNKIPKIFSNKKTVGIRIPDNNIIREISKKFRNPIISTSIIDDDFIIEYPTDPELIFEKYKDLVDIVIDGGYGMNVESTVVDCTNEDSYKIIRKGKGNIDLIY